MAQSVTCLPHKHEDLSSERASTPVPMHKATLDASAGERRQRDFPGLLAGDVCAPGSTDSKAERDQ